MQPLAYLALRALASWFQWLERDSHAFLSNSKLILAVGVGHSWAVVYALFIAVLTRSLRHAPAGTHHLDYLPPWVMATERIAMCSMSVWWFGGSAACLIHLVEDDHFVLPFDQASAGHVPALLRFVKAKPVRRALEVANLVSCAGLFVSVLLLCLALVFMEGTVTVCEACLLLIAFAFASPHAAVALHHLLVKQHGATETGVFHGVAAEAAAMGPQLCVVLAFSDVSGTAPMWHNVIHVICVLSFLAMLFACSQWPPKLGGASLPPSSHELIACVLMNAATAAAVVVNIPALNEWVLWLLLLVIAGLGVAVSFRELRDPVVELMEPVMPIMSCEKKLRPAPLREFTRACFRVLALASAGCALWDTTKSREARDVKEWSAPEPDNWEDRPRYLSTDPLMLRFLSRELPLGDGEVGDDDDEESRLMASARHVVSGILNKPSSEIDIESSWPDLNMVVFTVFYMEEENAVSLDQRWEESLRAGLFPYANVTDVSFPARLDDALCDDLLGDELPGDEEVSEELVSKSKTLLIEISSTVAQTTYLKACKRWNDRYRYHRNDHGMDGMDYL